MSAAPSATANVVLTGFMGTGKSTVGRLLADRLRRTFVDTDQVIEQRHGSIRSIFETKGEAAFRALERELAIELAAQSGLVVATGGRLLLDPVNRTVLEATGTVVCLVATDDEILERVQGDAERGARPLLAVRDPRTRILELLNERADAYAEFTQISTSDLTPEEIVDVLVSALGELSP